MRIAIIEDDPILSTSLGALLAAERDLEVAGVFGTAEEALERLPALAPAVAIVDLGLPGMSGLELIQALKASAAPCEVIVYTVNEDRQAVFAALRAGASGYVLKGAGGAEIVQALEQLRQGGAPMSPRIARQVIQEFRATAAAEAGEPGLTAREREILGLLERGLSYKEAAGALNLSVHTVHTHIKNIYEKLHARNRQQALLAARRMGAI
jgi:two-component system, NarL family, response regulator